MLRVKDLMTPQVQAVGVNETVDDALDVFVEYRLSAVPVVDADGQCVGVLTLTSLLDLARQYVDESHDLGSFAKVHHALLIEQLQKPGFAERRIGDVMATPARTVSPDIFLIGAAEQLVEDGIHHIFVADDDRRLVGVLSTMDVIRGFLKRAK